MDEQDQEPFPWILDAHSDIPGDLFLRETPLRLHDHIIRLRTAHVGAVIACLWGYADPRVPAGTQQLRQLELLEQGLASVENAALCHSPGEVLAARRRGDIAFILGIEGFEVPLEAIPDLHDRGMRHAMLRWSVDNAAVHAEHLTTMGKEVVREIEGRHWLMDVSHLPEPAFWELLDETRCPILASHSNAAALCANERNLSDAQLKALAERDGVVGLNAWPLFLSSEPAAREHFLRHLRYIVDLIGPEHVAFGFDFVDYLLDRVDVGAKTLTSGLAGLEDVPALMSDLMRTGYPPDETALLAHGNLLNLWKRVAADRMDEGGDFIGQTGI